MPCATRTWPAIGQITETVGLWCFGCGRKMWKKGTEPDHWIETLCSEPGCPVPGLTT